MASSVWPFGELRFSAAARVVPAPKNDLAYHKYDTQTTQKILLEEYSFITDQGRTEFLVPGIQEIVGSSGIEIVTWRKGIPWYTLA